MIRLKALVVLGALAGLVAGMVLVRGFVHPVLEEPFADGPVMVLGGSSARVVTGQEVLPEATEVRPLILSHASIDYFEATRGACDSPHVRCIRPLPATTWGEAQEIARLARQEGWSSVTVVTDDFHVPRSRLLMRRCLDVPVRVTGTGTAPDGVPLRLAVREAAAALVSYVIYHDC